MKISSVNRIRVVILGSRKCGKSAVTVRYLTKRYIGEYSSTGDFLYQHNIVFDGIGSEIEILDTSNCAIFRGEISCPALLELISLCVPDSYLHARSHTVFAVVSSRTNLLRHAPKLGCLADHVRWGDAFAVVYSICDRRSFSIAADILSLLVGIRLPGCTAVLLLGNKRDLEHAREVRVEDGQELSLRFGCQFYEVSAAESCAGVSLAFHALIREARALALLRPSPRRKLAVNSVSKVIGTIFGKNTSKTVRKKRPSLSI